MSEEQAAPEQPETEQQTEQQPADLLGEVNTTAETAQPQQETDAYQAQTYGNDPNVEPQVDPSTRPEGLPEKFNTVEELAQAYNEMGKKIREKFELPEGYESPSELIEEHQQLKEAVTPPEKYELNLPEGVEGLSEDDEAFFKELGLNNEKAQKVMDYFQEAVMPAVQQAQQEAEKERLGREWNMDPQSQHFTERLSTIRDWAQNNLPQSVVQELTRSANGVNAIYRMMNSQFNQSTAQTYTQQERVTPEQIESMVNDDRYWNDPAFRQEVERKIQNMSR